MKEEKVKGMIIASNVVWGLALIPSLVLLGLSALLFDAPGSEESFYSKLLFFSIGSFPVVSILSVVGAWLFYMLKKTRLSLLSCVLPLVSILLGIVALVLIAIFCDGSLVCS